MDLIIDASSIINLDNAKALDLVTTLAQRTFWLSPIVIGECEPTCAAELLRLQQMGRFNLVDPNNVSAEVFIDYLEQFELGEGETECLVLCLNAPYVLCCDDSKAREAACQLFGERWSRLSEQNLRVDKWNVCRG